MTVRETNAARLLLLPWPCNGDLRSFNEARGWQVYRIDGSKIEHCTILDANNLVDELSEVMDSHQLPVAFATAEMGLLPSRPAEELAQVLGERIAQDRRNSAHPLAGLQEALALVAQPKARLAVA